MKRRELEEARGDEIACDNDEIGKQRKKHDGIPFCGNNSFIAQYLPVQTWRNYECSK